MLIRSDLFKVAQMIYKSNCQTDLDIMYTLYCYLLLPDIKKCSKIYGSSYAKNKCINILQK